MNDILAFLLSVVAFLSVIMIGFCLYGTIAALLLLLAESVFHVSLISAPAIILLAATLWFLK